MKKLMTLALTTLAVVAAQAANINWTVSGTASSIVYDIKPDGSGSSTTTFSGSAYLIIADDLSSLSGLKSQSAFESALSAITLETVSVSAGAKPSVTKQLVSNDQLNDGTSTTFGLLVYSTDSDGNGYYKVATVSATPWADGTPTSAQKTVTTPWAKVAADTSAPWTKAWTKPQPVPEPATGALALAGVALLFRRRRA